ncbi:brachyurin-like [Neocloeon triangulifer]|uniref:brachyurin-like n=1 Tax=Neocloeon triangulifer TaxID=2078957 RepID=UPI00286F61C7|nr:brachyurin-like [Neocloeon triangulifer]
MKKHQIHQTRSPRMMKSLILFAALCATMVLAQDSVQITKIDQLPVQPKLAVRKGAPKPKNTIGAHIIGGTNATQGTIPYQALIYMDNSYICGGSLLTTSWILTAAHCVSGHVNFTVCLGTWDRNNAGAEAGSKCYVSLSSIAHESFNPTTLKNDIGLVKLPSAAVLSTKIALTRLPRRSDATKLYDGVLATASGWGRTSNSTSSASRFLLTVKMTVITNTECNNTFTITASNVCTSGAGTKSVCNGDSGGPLTVVDTDGLPTQIGLVSFGSSVSCMIGYPQAYTRLTSYLDWLVTKTGVTLRA